MRILLAGKFGPHGRRPIGGVQTWQRTVANCLIDMGHSVEFFQVGDAMPEGEFDLGIVANWNLVKDEIKGCERTVNVIHGPIDPEAPGGPVRVYTSEEVAEKWGEADGRVIRQPIDLHFWRPPEYEVPSQDLLTRFSYRGGLGFLPAIAERHGLKYFHLRDKGPIGVRSTLQRSAVVLATGRASLEAMACGVPVLICDHRSAYQGPLMDRSPNNAMRRNYSGRGGVAPAPGNIEPAIGEAMLRGSMRGHVKRHHDAEKITRRLLNEADLLEP